MGVVALTLSLVADTVQVVRRLVELIMLLLLMCHWTGSMWWAVRAHRMNGAAPNTDLSR
jgi:hypothetical protein